MSIKREKLRQMSLLLTELPRSVLQKPNVRNSDFYAAVLNAMTPRVCCAVYAVCCFWAVAVPPAAFRDQLSDAPA